MRVSRPVAVLVLLGLLAAGCGGGAGSPAEHQRHSRRSDRAATVRGAGIPLPHTARSHAAVPILMYHVIGTPKPGTPLPELWVTPEHFGAQMAALADAGYRAVTLTAVLNAWRGRGTLPARPVVLSFDDGYLGQGKYAGAVLAARHWPGVLNLAIHNLGVPGGLTAGRIRTMLAAGWELASHSITHPDLTTLGAAALRREVAGSRTALRRRFGVPVATFCYPAGRYNATVVAAVRAAGYRAATTVVPGVARPGDDRMLLPRIRVNGSDSPEQMLAHVRAATPSG